MTACGLSKAVVSSKVSRRGLYVACRTAESVNVIGYKSQTDRCYSSSLRDMKLTVVASEFPATMRVAAVMLNEVMANCFLDIMNLCTGLEENVFRQSSKHFLIRPT